MNWKLKYGLVGIILGIVLLCISISDAVSFLKTPIKIDSAEKITNLKNGDHVTLDIKMTIGALVKEISTTTKYGKEVDSKESSRYYAIPFLENGDIYAVNVKIGSADFAKMESGEEQFWNYIEGKIDEPSSVILSIEGIVKKMNDDEKKYTQEAKDTLTMYYFPGLYMDMLYINTVSKAVSFGITGLGIVFILVSVLFLVLFFKDKKKEKAMIEEIRANNAGYYQTPENVSFNNDIANDPRFAGVVNRMNQQPGTNPQFNQYGQTPQYGQAPQNVQAPQFDPNKITSDQINPGSGNDTQ